jgi:hypothetical protein
LHRTPPPGSPLVSSDGRFYWDGTKWVPIPTPSRGGGRSVLSAALLAVILLVAGSWALDNTRVGLGLKCRYLGDALACLTLALDEVRSGLPGDRLPTVPNPTARVESPEERARREEEERLAAVARASSALQTAIGDLTANSGQLEQAAAAMSAAAEAVASAVDRMDDVYRELEDVTSRRPLGWQAQEDVCLKLEDLEITREDVDIEAESFEIADDDYEWLLSERSQYLATVQSAASDLAALIDAHPDPAAAALLRSAEEAVATTDSTAEQAAIAAAQARPKIAELTAAADARLTEGRDLATAAASC